MLMYKQSSSINSTFVGLTKGKKTDDCDKASTSNDSIKSMFAPLLNRDFPIWDWEAKLDKWE